MMSALRTILLASVLGMSDQGIANAVAADAPAAAGEFSGALNALGTEPFWGMTIRASGLTFSRPGEDDVRYANPGPVIRQGSATWTLADPSARLKLTLTNEDCSDGMSDRHYSFKAVVAFEEKTLYGCADTPAAIAAQPAP